MPSPDVQPPGSPPPTAPVRATSAYYAASVSECLATTPEEVIGHLAMADPHRALESTQKLAWAEEIDILREALVTRAGEATLFPEFDVPRLGSRVDAVVIAGPIVVPIEFKRGEPHFMTAAYNQAWDYGLDLKNLSPRKPRRAVHPHHCRGGTGALLAALGAGDHA